MTSSRREPIVGYEAPIHRAVWERILTMGAPRVWSAVWMVTCLYAALVVLTVRGIRLVPIPLVVWALGQGVLVLLTQWDVFWDDITLAKILRRYKSTYEAG